MASGKHNGSAETYTSSAPAGGLPSTPGPNPQTGPPDVVLYPGVLREAANGRLVLWLPLESDGRGQVWQRVSGAAQAAVVQEAGLCVIPATAIRARQRSGGFWGGLAKRLRRGESDHIWRLPSGEDAEQEGIRQTDLVLVWSASDGSPLNEGRIREVWPESGQVRSLGPWLFLVEGVTVPAPDVKAETPVSDEPTQKQAEERLAAARRDGDKAAEATALADLGLAALDEGQLGVANAHLESALALARSLGDKAREADTLGILGLVAIKAGQPDEARRDLEQALAISRAVADRFTEKLSLQRMATVLAFQNDMPAAISALADALVLARGLGDRQHEADLLWHLAILHAESEKTAEALHFGQAAIGLLKALGRPWAEVYAEHLEKFRPASTSPGTLRMAISAAQALGRFVVSGLKTVPPQVLLGRLQRCGECEQYTGLRCRVCGCFVTLKARLPHEDCSLGKWKKEVGEREEHHGGTQITEGIER